jgi:hypothetical protein
LTVLRLTQYPVINRYNCVGPQSPGGPGFGTNMGRLFLSQNTGYLCGITCDTLLPCLACHRSKRDAGLGQKPLSPGRCRGQDQWILCADDWKSCHRITEKEAIVVRLTEFKPSGMGLQVSYDNDKEIKGGYTYYQTRSLNRWIFPVALLGSSSTNSIQRGYLYLASLSMTHFFISSSSLPEGEKPSRRTI